MTAIRSHLMALCFGLASFLFMPDKIAAQTVIEEIPFDNETITITEMEDGQQSLQIGDRELGRNWFASFDRVTEVAGYPVALFYLGEGGNACGPATVIIWRDDDGQVQSLEHADDCATPAPAVSDNGIYFVPYVAPGETKTLKAWSPSEGITTEGNVSFAPESGSSWTTLDGGKIFHPLDFFANADIYNAIAALTGDDLEEYAKGLRVASQPRKLSNGIRMASGCIPHNCGGGDSFIAVDAPNEAVYLAQQDGTGHRYWPTFDTWPENAKEAFGIYQSSR